MIPDVEPKQLEELCLRRIEGHEEREGIASICKYGEKFRMVNNDSSPFVDYKAVAEIIRPEIEDILRRLQLLGLMQERDVMNIAYFAAKASFGQFRKLMPSDGMTWIKIPSFPDFEMTVKNEGHAIFDCKRCNQASWPITDEYRKSQQFRHLMRRSAVGDITFLLIHFNSRPEIKTKKCPARTVAFPVHKDHPFWLDKSIRRITWKHCDEWGYDVKWDKPPQKRSLTPDIVDAVKGVKKLLELFND